MAMMPRSILFLAISYLQLIGSMAAEDFENSPNIMLAREGDLVAFEDVESCDRKGWREQEKNTHQSAKFFASSDLAGIYKNDCHDIPMIRRLLAVEGPSSFIEAIPGPNVPLREGDQLAINIHFNVTLGSQPLASTLTLFNGKNVLRVYEGEYKLGANNKTSLLFLHNYHHSLNYYAPKRFTIVWYVKNEFFEGNVTIFDLTIKLWRLEAVNRTEVNISEEVTCRHGRGFRDYKWKCIKTDNDYHDDDQSNYVVQDAVVYFTKSGTYDCICTAEKFFLYQIFKRNWHGTMTVRKGKEITVATVKSTTTTMIRERQSKATVATVATGINEKQVSTANAGRKFSVVGFVIASLAVVAVLVVVVGFLYRRRKPQNQRSQFFTRRMSQKDVMKF